MKVLFVVDRLGFQDLCSIPTVSAAAKRAGQETVLLEFGSNEDRAVQQAHQYNPDVVCYSVCSNEATRYLSINAKLKKSLDFYSVFGGPHPTYFPDMINEEGVDAICKGEGDLVFPRFLDKFGTAAMFDVSNFSFKLPDKTIRENPVTELVSDLDSLPFPDRDLMYSNSVLLARSPLKSFLSSRGCPFKCSYCFNHAHHQLYRGKGRPMRTKSVSYMVEEIKHVALNYPLSFVKFNDDVFGVERKWLEEFAEVYPKEIGLPFSCLTRPNLVTKEYARLLKKAGCYSFSTAIESGNEKIRKEALDRNVTDQQILDACSALRQEGIRLLSLNMLGLPGETINEVHQTIELNQKAGVDYADARIFQPYPGTKISEYCKKAGLLDEDYEEFGDVFMSSPLKFSQEFKNTLETIRSMFAMIVDYPWLIKVYPIVAKLRCLWPLVRLIDRFYFGFQFHRRIYRVKTPLLLQVRAALTVLFSKNRV